MEVLPLADAVMWGNGSLGNNEINKLKLFLLKKKLKKILKKLKRQEIRSVDKDVETS